MCGIAAIFAYDSSVPGVDEGELVSIRDCMAARGPDGAGLWFDSARRVGLGHRRLAIIDVSPAGAQPMGLTAGSGEQGAGSWLQARDSALHSPCSFWITFNGEIYNYRELRAELERKGCHFRSQCDTEILLHLYATEGEAMLGKLRGMFAFAIWDGVKQTLFLARDPFGIKPLYWADDGRTFRAASQVKALLAGGRIDTSPEPAGHVGYFLWGHVPAPYTLYRGIRNLPAGHCLTVEVGGKKRLRAFCKIPDVLAEAERDKAESRKQKTEIGNSASALRAALVDSVRHHLIADVPVGVFLSSGLDSTTIAALASEFGSQLRTVTLGFEEYRGAPNDETPLAEEVARRYGTDHQTIWVKRKDFESDLDRLLHAMDQPTNDGVNSYFISKAAAQAGLKVALSGLGGDELFGGYPSFQEIPRAVSALGPLHFPASLGRAFRVVSAPILRQMTSPKYAGLLEYGGTYGGAYLLRRGMFMPWELPGILDGDLVREGWNELQTLARLDDTAKEIHSPHLKVSALEMSWYMRHQLLRDADWASMDHSLEVRVPLVDVELLRATAPMFTNEPHPTKRDMALAPHSPLPVSVLNRPKTGFQVPVRQWLLDSQNASGRRSVVGGHPGERGLRGWVREVYSIFAGTLEDHRASLQRRRNSLTQSHSHRMGEGGRRPGEGLRICVLLTDGFGGIGGIAKFNRDFLSALCSHPNVEGVKALPRLMPNPPVPVPPKLNYDTSGLGGKLRYTRAVLAAARSQRPENGGQRSVVSGQRSRRPSFDLLICAHINLLPVALLMRSRLPIPCPLYLIIHGVDAWQPTRSRLANASARRVDGFISVSNVTKHRFMRWSHLRDDQGVVLPNCVDLSDFAPGPKAEALVDRYHLRGKKVMLTFGRLASEERYKGFDEVLEIMPSLLAEMPDLCYLICGDGQDRPRLEQKAAQLGIHDRVIFAGYVPETEKADHYRLADVYVMPSSGEGFGIVYLEALACGVPVIGSRADGSREALLNGRLGILVDPRDREEIKAAVRKALKQSRNDESRKQKVEVRSQRSEVGDQKSDGHSLDYFSTARFQRRVHDILDCITN